MLEFDELRATQAAAVVVTMWGCGAAKPRAHYATVLALLMIADKLDREHFCCIETWDESLLWRRVPADYERTTIPHAWDRFFEVDGEDLVLLADPGDDELNDFLVETLQHLCMFVNMATAPRAKMRDDMDKAISEKLRLAHRFRLAQTDNAELFRRQLEETQKENVELRAELIALRRKYGVSA